MIENKIKISYFFNHNDEALSQIHSRLISSEPRHRAMLIWPLCAAPGCANHSQGVVQGQKLAWHSRDSAGQENHIQSRDSRVTENPAEGLGGQTSSRISSVSPRLQYLNGESSTTPTRKHRASILEATGSE